MKNQIQEKIVDHLQHLNSFQLAEILDFTEFLRHKRKKTFYHPDVIDKLCGKYKNCLSHSDEFARKKAEEIIMEEEKWKRI